MTCTLTLSSLGDKALEVSSTYDTELLLGQMRSVTTTPGESRRIVVQHRVSGAVGVGGAHETNLNTLKRDHYYPNAGKRWLKYVDGDNVAKQVLINDRKGAARLLPLDGVGDNAVFRGELTLDAHVARAQSAESTVSGSKTTVPATLSVTNNGNVNTPFTTITLTPTAARSAANGQRYRRPMTIVPHAPRGGRTAVDVAGGWDHAAEAAASRSSTSGDDVEVYVNQDLVWRWAGDGISAFNTSATRLWIEMDLPPERYWTLSAAISSAGATSATVKEDLDVMTLPQLVVIDGEAILITARDPVTRTVTIARGQRGTTAATHSAGAKAYCAIPVDIVYGWTSASAPVQDDRFKPIPAAHASSTNAAWTFAAYQESAAANRVSEPYPRRGSWELVLQDKLDRKDVWLDWIPWTASLGSNATPATAMCIGYQSGGGKGGQPLVKAWRLPVVVGISSMTYDQTTTGLTFVGAGGPPYEGRLEVRATLEDGTDYRAATHANSSTTGSSVSFNIPATDVRLELHPYDPTNKDYVTSSVTPGAPGANNGFSVTNVTVTFDSSQQISVVAGSRQDIHQFGRPDSAAEITVRDAASAELTMKLYGIVVVLNDALTIDVDDANVYSQSGNLGHGGVWGGVLPEAQPGAVTVEYDDPRPIGTVTFACTLYSAWRV